MNAKLGVVDQQLLKTTNRKQQNTDYVLLLVENCDIKLEILNKLSHLSLSVTLKTVMSELFFYEGFPLGHVIITTIIKSEAFKNTIQALFLFFDVIPSLNWYYLCHMVIFGHENGIFCDVLHFNLLYYA